MAVTAARLTWKDGRTETLSGPLEAARWIALVQAVLAGQVASLEPIADGPAPGPARYRVSGPLNVRDAPGGKVVGTLPDGVTVEGEAHAWRRVQGAGAAGWVADEYLTAVAEKTASEPATRVLEADAPPEPTLDERIAAERLPATAYTVGSGIVAEMRARGDSPASDEFYLESVFGRRWALAHSYARRLYVYDGNTDSVTVVG